ncbi:MAG: hypothetical protein MI802_28515, partial [Desulfobacterales bacterium]|nr:hypothetical protein [Desulfobacterales bacterium]
PVITSRAAGCSCVVTPGKNGFVFDEPGQLSGMLDRFRDKARRHQMGIEARKTAETHTWEDTARQYESLYYEISGKKFRTEAALQNEPGSSRRSSLT